MKFEDIKFPDVKKVAVSLSGGLDSTTLTYCLVKRYGAENVHALSFYYKQKQYIELEKAKLTSVGLGIIHKIIDISFLGDIASGISSNIQGSNIQTPTIQDILGDPAPSTQVPNRNAILTSILVAYAEAQNCNAIFSAIQSHDLYSYFDTTPDFWQCIRNMAMLNRKHLILVETPFMDLSKSDEIEIGTEIDVNYTNTLTCYNPNENGISDGTCPSCAERIIAFAKNGIIDPVKYAKNIPWSDLIKQYS
jgi:7-cyano-7-deazaguanine synthase